MFEQEIKVCEEQAEQTVDVVPETRVEVGGNYERLTHKPQINGVELIGDKTASDLGLISEEYFDEVSNHFEDRIDQESVERAAEDEHLNTLITGLGDELNAEINARTQADTAIENEVAKKANQTALTAEATARSQADTALGGRIDTKADITALTAETTNRENADNELQSQIDAITSQSDVVDIVGTYAELEAYDTEHLGDNDIIKVLTDVNHDNAPSYYRWNKTEQTWSYVGSESVAYTKAEADDRFVPKTRTINNKALSANITLTTNDLTNDSGYLTESDLTDYVKNTDYSTATKAGVVRDANCFLTSDTNGGAYAETMSYATYANASSYNFVGKGTLENVLNSRKYLMPEYTLELPTTGEANKLYLTPAAEQPDIEASASGKDIEISDASEGDLIDWTIKGDTEQDGEPTPTTPQEVKTVTGRNTVSVVGKNLIDKTKSVNGNIIANSKQEELNSTNLAITSDWFKVEPNTTYVVGGERNRGRWQFKDKYGNIISNSVDANSITTPSNAVLARVYYWWSDNNVPVAPTDKNVQVEKGSVPTSFQPYSGQEVEINLGKNLFDKNNASFVHKYPEGGDSSRLLTSENAVSFYVPVVAGETYTLSCNSELVDQSYSLYFVGENPEIATTCLSKIIKVRAEAYKPLTLKAPEGSKYACLYMIWSTNQSNIDTVKNATQLERGDKATEYAEYFEPIELCKLGDYQDRIFKDGDTWKIEKKVGEHELTSSSNWLIPNPTSYPHLFQATIGALQLAPEYLANVDKLPAYIRQLRYTNSSTVRNEQGFAIYTESGTTNRIVRINISSFSTVAEIKTWLDENDVKLYYALATPVVTEITYQPLIDQLNELETLATVKGYNHITTDTPSVQPFLEFGYFRPDPTVTKDEWLWVENHYEQLGGERRYTHNISVNHHTAQGHWDYAFTIVGKEASHYTQLAQVAYYLFKEHAGLHIPVSGTYTEGNNVYLLTKITASSLNQVTIEMRKLSDGSVRSISTGAVAVSDTIS